MARLQARGLTMDLPPGWDGRIKRREAPPVEARVAAADVAPPAPALAHAATFSLPSAVGDYGSGAVEQMGADDLFIALIEFDRDSLGSALFSARRQPRRVREDEFHPQALQRTLPGQAGTQVFFTEAGRPFCLYVVLGSFARRTQHVPEANAVLRGVRIS